MPFHDRNNPTGPLAPFLAALRRQHASVFLLSDVGRPRCPHKPDECKLLRSDSDWVPLVEQLVCARARKFVPAHSSTWSTAVMAHRGVAEWVRDPVEVSHRCHGVPQEEAKRMWPADGTWGTFR